MRAFCCVVKIQTLMFSDPFFADPFFAERINQLPRTKQQFVMQVIDSVLAQATR